MEYDADGNLTRKYLATDSTVFNQRLEWNSLGELVKTTTNGAVALYRYDGLGRWAQHETGSAGSTEYLYDGDHLLLERSPAGAITEYTYYPGIDQPHSLRRDTSAYYYLQDRSGNVRGLMSPAPALANQYVYDPFGNRLEATENVTNALQYQARHYDPSSKLYHFRARWYDPLLERFVSEDPIGLAGGINPYTYAGNDPVNRRDPLGLTPCDPFAAGGHPCFSTEHEGVVGYGEETRDLLCRHFGYCGSQRPAEPAMVGMELVPGGAAGAPSQVGQEQCKGGFSRAQCAQLERALRSLRNHKQQICSDLGRSATTRFRSGNFRFEPRASHYGYVTGIPYGRMRFEATSSLLHLGPRAFRPRQLANTIAHEEYHQWGYDHPLNTIVGAGCAGSI